MERKTQKTLVTSNHWRKDVQWTLAQFVKIDTDDDGESQADPIGACADGG